MQYKCRKIGDNAYWIIILFDPFLLVSTETSVSSESAYIYVHLNVEVQNLPNLSV